ncbi:MAG: VWA domain-containing protein [Deltaproteobacteria bacterium]|nr:VWA domain-containing protein [Deltaproteobacteria bacterium]
MQTKTIPFACLLGAVAACGTTDAVVGNPSTGGTDGSQGSGGSAGAWGSPDALVLTLPDGPGASGQDKADAGLSSADGENCGISRNEMDRIPADLLVVQDRSGTMRHDEKWAQVTTAVNEVVSQTQSAIRWGLKLYAMPYPSDEDIRCFVPDEVTVPVDFDNAATISAALADNPPTSDASGSATPTRFAIEKALAYLQSVDDGSPKHILLATDGLPNCGNGIMSADDYDEDDEDGAIAAVAAANAAGVPVFVVGIDIGGGGDTLDDMAVAGGRPRDDSPRYYPASATTGLVEALQQVVGSIPTCTFALSERPPVPDNIAVDAQTAAGVTVRIPKDVTHTTGWDYTDATATGIQIYGTWCDEITNGNIKVVEAIFGCPDQVIP